MTCDCCCFAVATVSQNQREILSLAQSAGDAMLQGVMAESPNHCYIQWGIHVTRTEWAQCAQSFDVKWLKGCLCRCVWLQLKSKQTSTTLKCCNIGINLFHCITSFFAFSLFHIACRVCLLFPSCTMPLCTTDCHFGAYKLLFTVRFTER